MKLSELEKERDKYASRIGKLALQIALIFAIPAALAVLAARSFDVRVVYTLPIAFIVSWVMVISLYRKVDRKVRTLEEQIRKMKKEESSPDVDEITSDI